MTVKTVCRVVLVSVLALAWGREAQAECISIRETAAERFDRTALVFYGEVLKVETVILDPEPFVYRVRFRVDQPYKGTTRGEQTFDFGTTAESFVFKQGQRVLVWAHRDSRARFGTQCSPTRTATSDDSELTGLRKMSGR